MSNIQFFEYQKEAAKHVISDLKNHNRSLLVMATGSGKTHTALGILDHFLTFYIGKRVLILAHRREILDQWETYISEVFDQDMNVFSSQEDLTKHKQFYTCSFQRAWDLLKNGTLPTSFFDYVIVDEAHHAQAPTYRSVLEHLQYDWIFGLTATPDRLDGADIRTIFGHESFTYDLATAIADGALTPATIKIRSCQITEEVLEHIRTEVEKKHISRTELERRIFIRSKLSEECRMIQEECKNEQALVFCGSIIHAQEVASYLPNTGVLTYKQTSGVNQRILHQFKTGEIQFLISIDKLIEGIDLPFVGYGFSLRSTASPTIIWQQIGRVLRRHEGKEQAVFVDFVGNFEKIKELKSLEEQIQVKVATSENTADRDDNTIQYLNSVIDFVWGNEVHELYDLLQKQEKYSTLEEIQGAWQDLVIKYNLETTCQDYKDNYHLDPKLPSWNTVTRQFKISWNEFLEKEVEKYSTLEEIQEAWQNVVIKYDLKNTYQSYKDNYTLDPKLPSWSVINEQFKMSWNEFLGKGKRKDKYSTLEEMQEAWQDLVVQNNLENTRDSYHNNYHLDPKLPSWPTVRKWFNISWNDFKPDSGNEKYSTLEEMQEAWQDLVVQNNLENTSQSYKDNYHLDPKLPSWYTVTRQFKISWKEFLGKEEKQEKYSTLKEMQEAWQDVVIKYDLKNTCQSYKDNYHLDPKLPSWATVKQWFNISWNEFLEKEVEKYSTLEEIQEAWKNVVIKYDLKNTYQSYKDNYHLDPKLPSWSVIKEQFKMSWNEFLGKSKRKEKYSTLEEIQEAWQYLVVQNNLENTRDSYHNNYHLDPKLPSWNTVPRHFKISWNDFKPDI